MSFLCTYKERYVLSFLAGWVCIYYILLFLVLIIYGTTEAANDTIRADGSFKVSPVKGLWGSAFGIYLITHICIVSFYQNDNCRIEKHINQKIELDRMNGIWSDKSTYKSIMQSQPNMHYQPNMQYATPIQQGLIRPDPNQPIVPIQNTMPAQNLAPIQQKPIV
jgi:hypothetical protein